MYTHLIIKSRLYTIIYMYYTGSLDPEDASSSSSPKEISRDEED